MCVILGTAVIKDVVVPPRPVRIGERDRRKSLLTLGIQPPDPGLAILSPEAPVLAELLSGKLSYRAPWPKHKKTLNPLNLKTHSGVKGFQELL